MDPKHASSGPEVQALRNQLQEKERHIEQLEVSYFMTFEFSDLIVATSSYTIGPV